MVGNFKRVALIVGTGAVENSWEPILQAIEEVFDITTTPDGANCLFARDVYLARYFASTPKRKKDLDGILTQITLLKTFIAMYLMAAQRQKIIRPRKELKKILQKFIFHKDVAAILISANWDTVIDDEIQRILKLKLNKFGMEINGFHIHGSVAEFTELYLPSEHCNETYRNKEETKKLEQQTALFVHNVEIADKVILYGLSLDPLDAELSQAIGSCCGEGKLKEIIIINPDYQKVAERVKVLNDSEIPIKITCYNPWDLETEMQID